jgi:hypothetical protein
MVDLLDASVWVPLSAPDHVHHVRARRYCQTEASGAMAFCRVTALALLRHVTNPTIHRTWSPALDRCLSGCVRLGGRLSSDYFRCRLSEISEARFSPPHFLKRIGAGATTCRQLNASCAKPARITAGRDSVAVFRHSPLVCCGHEVQAPVTRLHIGNGVPATFRPHLERALPG